MNKPILDPCCGARMFYFDKNNPLVLFGDIRSGSTKLCDGRNLVVQPEQLMDFRHLPFGEASFNLVIFDPPHLRWAGEKSDIRAKYGVLKADWAEMLKRGFAECYRVLKPGHVLVFKWCETQIPTKTILQLFDKEPVLGNRSGKAAKTHWMLFYKEDKNDS